MILRQSMPIALQEKRGHAKPDPGEMTSGPATHSDQGASMQWQWQWQWQPRLQHCAFSDLAVHGTCMRTLGCSSVSARMLAPQLISFRLKSQPYTPPPAA